MCGVVRVCNFDERMCCGCVCVPLQSFDEVVSGTLTNMDLFGNWTDVFEMVGKNSHPTTIIWGNCDEVMPLPPVCVCVCVCMCVFESLLAWVS